MSSDAGISQFAGKWKVDKTRDEHIDDFLKERGVNFAARKVALQATPVQEISVDGNKVTIKMETAIKTTNETVTLGVEESRKIDGKNVKILATYEGGKLKIESTFVDEGDKKVIATREIVEGDLLLTWKINDIEAKRYFKKK